MKNYSWEDYDKAKYYGEITECDCCDGKLPHFDAIDAELPFFAVDGSKLPFFDVDGGKLPYNYAMLMARILVKRKNYCCKGDLYLYSSEALNKALMLLDRYTAKILVKKFGLVDGRMHTTKEVAEDLSSKYSFQVVRSEIDSVVLNARDDMWLDDYIYKLIRPLTFDDIKNFRITDEERTEIEYIEKDVRRASIMTSGAITTEDSFDMSRLDIIKKICKRQGLWHKANGWRRYRGIEIVPEHVTIEDVVNWYESPIPEEEW